MSLFLFLGLMTAFCGCSFFYLASPHQRWFTTAFSARTIITMRVVGLLLLMVSQIAFLQALQTLAAVFAFITSVMLKLIILPYLFAWLSARRSS